MTSICRHVLRKLPLKPVQWKHFRTKVYQQIFSHHRVNFLRSEEPPVDAAWFDKSPVNRLSNYHFPVDHDTLEHWFSAKRGKRPPNLKLVENLEGFFCFCPIVQLIVLKLI